MITYLNGKLIEKNPSYLVLEVNGVGYFVHISLQTYSAIGDNENCKIFTYLSIKEDSSTLFGFAKKPERELFVQLISVSGVGTNTARMMLSSMTSQEIVNAIAHGNVDALVTIKGIGSKTAQRIILDLKDKILKTSDINIDNSNGLSNTIINEALSALTVLGFDKKKTEKKIQSILIKNPDIKDVESLIKITLKSL